MGRDRAESRHLCIGRDRVLGRKMKFCVGMGVTVERRSWMVRMPWIKVLLLMERLLSTHGTSSWLFSFPSLEYIEISENILICFQFV